MKNSEERILNLCKSGVDKAIQAGADASEILALNQSEVTSEIEMAQISQVSKRAGSSFSIRVFKDKRMGAAFTNIPEEDEIEKAVELAIAAARVSTFDEDWRSLPAKSPYSTLKDLYNEELASKHPSEIVELTAALIEESTKAEEGLIPMGGGSGVVITSKAYANSIGVEHFERDSNVYSTLAAVAKTKEGMTPIAYTFDVKKSWDIDVDAVVNEVAETIKIIKRSAKGKTEKSTVIFHPIAYSQMLQYTLIQSVQGDNVTRGKSKIADSIGDEVASEKISIVDDGLCPEGIDTQISDDEGVPRQVTTIIDRGVLKSFIWDHYWATKRGLKSTGNAKRDLRQGLVNIAPTTIRIPPGKQNVEDVISSIKHGYYIRDVQGAHSSNPESGDFSIVGNPAMLIENGELRGAINGLMVSGNIFELLRNVVEVASEPKNIMSFIAPEIICENISIICR
jgi:PmbA protein